MRKSLIVIASLTIVLFFAGLTACTAQNESTEGNTEPSVTPVDLSGEVYENEATGIGIVFPPEYIEKYTILQSDVDMYSVLHNATNALFKEKDPDSYRGFLFTIEKWPLSAKEDIDNLNEAAIPLIQTDEFAYFIRRSTPMDCYTDDMNNPATKEYAALYADDMIEKIAASAYLLADTNNTDYALSPGGKPWFNESPSQRGVFWFGMTFEEAVQAFSENGLVAGESASGDNTSLSTNNSQEWQNLIFNGDGKLDYFTIMVRPHFLEDNTGDTRMYTEKGIGLGDTFEKVEALYGKPSRVENEDDRRSVVYSYKIGEESSYYLLFVANGLPDVVDAIIYNVRDDTSF